MSEPTDCRLMLAASNWHTLVSFQLLVSAGVIGNNGLFQPSKVKWLQQWQHALCIVERPTHIGIGHHIDAVAHYFANRSHQLDVALHSFGSIYWSPAETQLHCLVSFVLITPRLSPQLIQRHAVKT